MIDPRDPGPLVHQVAAFVEAVYGTHPRLSLLKLGA
jgi:hypothetical protein